MNKMTKIVAALLVLAGLLFAVLALRLGRQQAKQPASPPLSQASVTQYTVVVAGRTLDAGAPIASDGLKIVMLSHRPDGGFANVSDVIGHVPRVAVAAGAPVTRGVLAQHMAEQLATGERAIAIPVNEVSGAGNRIKPGDYVDVFFTLKPGQDAGETQARLLVPHLRVLSYGNASLDDASSGAGGIDMKTRQPSAMTAVLAVPVDQVNAIALATQNGKLLLALRSPFDGTRPDTGRFARPAPVLAARPAAGKDPGDPESPDDRAYAGIALAGLAGETHAVAKRPAASHAVRGASATPRTIEVIRGAQRESVAF